MFSCVCLVRSSLGFPNPLPSSYFTCPIPQDSSSSSACPTVSSYYSLPIDMNALVNESAVFRLFESEAEMIVYTQQVWWFCLFVNIKRASDRIHPLYVAGCLCWRWRPSAPLCWCCTSIGIAFMVISTHRQLDGCSSHGREDLRPSGMCCRILCLWRHHDVCEFQHGCRMISNIRATAISTQLMPTCRLYCPISFLRWRWVPNSNLVRMFHLLATPLVGHHFPPWLTFLINSKPLSGFSFKSFMSSPIFGRSHAWSSFW